MIRTRNRAPGALAATLALTLFAGAPALAQEGGGIGQGQGGARGEAAELQQELRTLQRQIGEIRTSAMENNPELQERQSSLQDEVMTRMRDEGVDPEEDIRELQDMATELRSGELSESEQQELAGEYQETRQTLLEARRTVLEDEEIQSAQEEFREDLITAMEAENPDVRELIEDFENVREELRAQMGGAGQRGGGGAGQPGGGQSGGQ